MNPFLNEFCISENKQLVATGKMQKLDQDDKANPNVKVELKQNNKFLLKKSEIYRKLALSAFHYGENFQVLETCDQTGQNNSPIVIFYFTNF